MKLAHSAGRSSCGKMAVTGHSSTHSPQSMHVSGSMYSISAASKSASSFVGWMQSTGQTATQAVSFVPMQGWAIMWAMTTTLLFSQRRIIEGLLGGATGRPCMMNWAVWLRTHSVDLLLKPRQNGPRAPHEINRTYHTDSPGFVARAIRARRLRLPHFSARRG